MPADIVRLIICARKISLLLLCHAYLYLLHIIIRASGVFSFSPHAILLSAPKVEKELHFGLFAASIYTPSCVAIKAKINHVLSIRANS